MKLSAAWRALARHFEKRTRAGTSGMYFALCPTTDDMQRAGKLTRVERDALRARIALDINGPRNLGHCPPAFGDYSGVPSGYETRETLREARILAALMFACEAEDAEREAARKVRKSSGYDHPPPGAPLPVYRDGFDL